MIREFKNSAIKNLLILSGLICLAQIACAQEKELEVLRPGMSLEQMQLNSLGCQDCHTKTDALTMHTNPAVVIGCSDCHGGNPQIRAQGLTKDSPEYDDAKNSAHVLPRNPQNWPSSANPQHSYTNLLKEPAEFVKFINPGDLRVANTTCGGCHSQTVAAVKKSLMTTSAMLWGGAAYNNGILPYKVYLLGENYNQQGVATSILAGKPLTDQEKLRGALEKLVPMPQWEVLPPADNFRIFERGGKSIKTQFPEIANPNKEEDAGRPDVKAGNRGVGTGNRIAVPVINIHKTRLNDPHLSFMGTNDHPGDYRSSGCSGCHVIYANDRDPSHSGPYSKLGHEGKSQTIDPTISKEESGHPIEHKFTRQIPTSQCMVCHMHQPNMFVNSFLGYTMWDYESDAPHMWPKKQQYPTIEETYQSFLSNPEEAASRGLWKELSFLKKVSELNPKLKDTQFADYHGHGWNFRAVYKRDRKGNLLDKDDQKVSNEDPQKFKKSVLLADIHVDKGMHCVDCHFSKDSHGDGNIYGEVAQAVEIQCQDCHGTVKNYTNLKTSGPAAGQGNDLSLMRSPFGENRFQWRTNNKGEKKLYQRSSLEKNLEWEVKQVKDIINPKNSDYNKKAARAKTVQKWSRQDANSKDPKWGNLKLIDSSKSLDQVLAHNDDNMSCFTCHSSWATSCGGCHLPIQANWKKTSNHYDGKETRNWATYNPQVARDEMFQIGKHGPAKGGKIVPVRSSSALVLSSTDINRQKIYIQQPPIAASGHSSQAFAPHFPHTVRTKETKTCNDCHISENNDNNAILSQLLLFGTNFVNFMGYMTYVATGEEGLEAAQVTEWDEPQAVIGSYLHKYAYPDYYQQHQDHNQVLQTSYRHHGAGGATNTIQMRGEYLYTTAGEAGFRAYDIANIANKGFSERIVTAPVSPLGHDTHVATKNATSFVLPTVMPIDPTRKVGPENLETPMHEIYHYALIADSEEGLILVNVDTLADRDPENNFLERALTWNENGILNGAKFITMAGTNVFICTADKLVILDLDKPLKPKVITQIPFDQPNAVAIQFRYAFVVDHYGLHVVDITKIAESQIVESAKIKLNEARNIYLARTYAYISGGSDGLIIVDIEKPEQPKIYTIYNDQGKINDLNDVKTATTNASLFAYLADGKNGLKVLQLTDPDRVPGFYGFSPEVKPLLISQLQTGGPALAISKPLDRDRAVDETGHQVSIFGRIGSRPLNLFEMQKLYLKPDGSLYKLSN